MKTTLQPSTASGYRYTLRRFLGYLRTNFPEIGKPSQLRRDPHLLGWLEDLWTYRSSAGLPLAGSTRGHHVARLRTLLEKLADGPHPPQPGLLRGEDNVALTVRERTPKGLTTMHPNHTRSRTRRAPLSQPLRPRPGPRMVLRTRPRPTPGSLRPRHPPSPMDSPRPLRRNIPIPLHARTHRPLH